jgi:hypothetical protein
LPTICSAGLRTKADNPPGCSAINVDLKTVGCVQLPVTGTVITDRLLVIK